MCIFFPPKPAALTPYHGNKGPFPQPLGFTPLPVSLICKIILKTHPHKAPGLDKIPNIILHKTVHVIAPLLHNCLLTILRLNYYPKTWGTWTTIVLHKSRHPEYTAPKAYRLIAPYNMLGKVLTSTMTNKLVYITMQHNLLPLKCFSGLPCQTTTDSLLYLVHDIKNAWRQRR